MTPKKDAYMRGYVDGFKDGMAEARKAFGETGMVPVTGKERPMLRPEAASTEARFESASLHQSNAIWPNWGDRPDGFDGPTGAE